GGVEHAGIQAAIVYRHRVPVVGKLAADLPLAVPIAGIAAGIITNYVEPTPIGSDAKEPAALTRLPAVDPLPAAVIPVDPAVIQRVRGNASPIVAPGGGIEVPAMHNQRTDAAGPQA